MNTTLRKLGAILEVHPMFGLSSPSADLSPKSCPLELVSDPEQVAGVSGVNFVRLSQTPTVKIRPAISITIDSAVPQTSGTEIRPCFMPSPPPLSDITSPESTSNHLICIVQKNPGTTSFTSVTVP
ncbi:hypothetical protein D9758_013066 [Tetrapyrgos nigripes]|uniref:Uncharacterized protein n=1 Tax=Tetrapyrgos nigripes TaxID=182062 RepID=A0A8H5FR17_9AGAR|nr:hypothetical protein D9758_013066 [Tetrapyrgos nigripes]